ncbi:acid-sensing ion channel 4-A-like [Saccoglossus kowalevskii]
MHGVVISARVRRFFVSEMSDRRSPSVLAMDNFGYDNSGSDNKINTGSEGTQSKEVEERKGTSRGTLVLFTQEAGISGLKYIGDSSAAGWRRLLWLVIVLLALCGLLYQTVTMVTSFVSLPVNINIVIEKPEVKQKFPAVTVCNNNMFRISLLSESLGGAGILELVFPYLYKLFPMDGLKIFGDDIKISPEMNYGNVNKTLMDFMLTNVHSAEDLIRGCSFGALPCGPENFTRTITNYGICYTFNSGKEDHILKVLGGGQKFGLHLYLYANEEDYIGPRTTVGFRLIVHEQDEIPDVVNQGLSIAPGTQTSIGMTTTIVSNLGEPFNDCVEDVENELQYFDGNYSLSKCWMECETDYVIEQCGCRYFYMPGDRPYCTPYELTTCYFEAMDNFSLLTDQCSHCTDPCQTTMYNTKLSYAFYPSQIFAGLLASSSTWPCDEAIDTTGVELLAREDSGYVCKRYMRDNFSKTTVYFEDLKIQSINQQRGYEPFKLVCDIGGTLGLFFGASMVTFLEIIDFFILQFWRTKLRSGRIQT